MATEAIAVTPIHVADLHVEGAVMPVCVHLIDNPHGRILVDTGFTELHPAVSDMQPTVYPLDKGDLDLASVDLIVNTHLHFDHCGGNALFPGVPIHVQASELHDARILDNYTIRECVDAPGVDYVEVDGEAELLPGVRLVPAPGHTRGSQIVVIDGMPGPTIIAGDTAVWFGELDDPQTEGQRLVLSLKPAEVWLSHVHEPWRPGTSD